MLNKKPIGFDERLQHSIELLQKAEKIALRYDSEHGYYLAFSGGKDSQALYHVAKLAGVKFQAHMNFTSVDPPQVVRFVRNQYPNVITHAPQKSIYQLAIERGILPSMRIRWCCADLKETAGAGKVTLIGIRKSESARRARRKEVEVSNRKFSGGLESFKVWQAQELERREAKLLRKMKREGKKVNEDEFSLQKDNEVRCINGKDSILVSPIFEWSEQDVWYFLNEVAKVPHCELYDQGWHRIGCINCPMASAKQKQIENERWPHVRRNWIKAIMRIRSGGGTNSPTSYQKDIWRADSDPKAVWRDEMATTLRTDVLQRKQPVGGYERKHQDERLARRGQPTERCSKSSANGGFSASSSSVGLTEEQEREIAENIYDWWISGKGYKKWYAEKFLQQKFDFDTE